MDAYPDQFCWIAATVSAFSKLLRYSDCLLGEDPAIVRERDNAVRLRAASISAMTAEGMGIVERPKHEISRLTVDLEQSTELIEQLLSEGANVDAHFVARNAIARQIDYVRGFGAVIAKVYDALHRPEFAEVALRSYEPTDKQIERLIQFKRAMGIS